MLRRVIVTTLAASVIIRLLDRSPAELFGEVWSLDLPIRVLSFPQGASGVNHRGARWVPSPASAWGDRRVGG